jgi:endonuclease YncB( thermonuclease family)
MPGFSMKAHSDIKVILLFLAAVLSLSAIPEVRAEIFSWTDALGNMHFTDDPSKIPANPKKNLKREGEEEAKPWVTEGTIESVASPVTVVLSGGRRITLEGVVLFEGDTGAESTKYLEQTVVGKFVNIAVSEKKSLGSDIIYGYIFLDKNRLINAELVQNGFMRAADVNNPHQYSDLFDRLEKKARETRLGLWKKIAEQEKQKQE